MNGTKYCKQCRRCIYHRRQMKDAKQVMVCTKCSTERST